MTAFFRFPSTSHLTWLAGVGVPRGDKLLTQEEAQALLVGEVAVEEKLDGANLGFSLGPDGDLRMQNRGQYLDEPLSGQFARLTPWLAIHGDVLRAVLEPELILFGEWCAARHSLGYSTLPDWFLLFDVYDRLVGRFWSTADRNTLALASGLATVPQLSKGHTTLATLQQMVMRTPSRYRNGLPLEGVVVRRESTKWCEDRAKLVRPDFAQSISTHWRRRAIEWNRLDYTITDGKLVDVDESS